MAGPGYAGFGTGGFAPSSFKAPGPPKVPGAAKGSPPKTYYGGWNGGTFSNNVNHALGGQGPAAQPTGTGLAQPLAAPPAAPASSGSSAGSPLDAAYYANVAQNQFAVNNHINALNLQQSQDQNALQTALAALAYQQPRDQLALEQKANAGGGLYSSVEDMNQANLVHNYATRQTADQSNYNNAVSKIAAQIAALQQGIPIYNAGQAADAGQRAAQAALNNPALAAPPAAAPAPPPAAPAARPAAKPAAKPTQRSIIAAALAGHPNWRGR